jgi:hypothetical protein
MIPRFDAPIPEFIGLAAAGRAMLASATDEVVDAPLASTADTPGGRNDDDSPPSSSRMVGCLWAPSLAMFDNFVRGLRLLDAAPGRFV